MRRPVPTTVLAAALAVSALAGCSAGVKHAAVKTGISSTTTSTVKGHRGATTTTSTKGSATTVSAGGGTSGGGATGGGGTSGGGGTATTVSGATTTTAPTGLAQVTGVTMSTAPTCQSAVDSSTVTVSWTSKNATQIWLLPGSVASALVGADAKTTTPNYGPLPPNGSKTFPFDCANQDNYVLVEAYNATSHNGVVQQLPNSVDLSAPVN
jgi:hypothetical protein